ncbi:ABC transporter permease subunit [Candidatus Kaiserbacteria bacterium]|nr:ABC transporter permease subunit [Candidatus Kaiserbacteria bacterium]
MNTIFLQNVLTVAKNTFKETVRNKILYGILLFALVYMLFTLFLGSISLGEDLHVIRSLGLAGIYIFSIIITVFLGSSLLYREIERKTLYFVLSKPVSHAHLVLGKFFGLLASVAVAVVGMAVVYLAVVAFKGGGFDAPALLAILYQLLEMALLIALSIFFSTFSTPLLSTLYAVLLIYIGHSLDMLVNTVAKSSVVVKVLAQAIYYTLPNLTKFDIRDLATYGAHVSLAQTALVILYALVYVIVLLYMATFLFEKREL